MNVLDGLSVVVKDVHPHHSLVELGVGALDQLVVEVLLVVQGIKALEDEVEEGVEVLGAGRSDKDVGVSKADRSSNGKAEGGGLATPSGSGERDRRLQGLLGYRFNEFQQAFGLVQRPKIFQLTSFVNALKHKLK